jgi:hypothetical protein
VTTPLGKPGAQEQVLDELGAARHVRRVLEDHDVARHDRGRRDADELPEGEVPRHDRQDGTDRVVAVPASRPGRRDDLVLQNLLGVLGVVAHHVRALRGLALGGGEGLAHLAREHLAHHGDLTLEQFRGAVHQDGPVGDRRVLPGLKGETRVLERTLHLFGRVTIEFGDDFFGGGIDGDE